MVLYVTRVATKPREKKRQSNLNVNELKREKELPKNYSRSQHMSYFEQIFSYILRIKKVDISLT